MSRTTATICKFIGTISLGLLTGVTYTTLTTTLPPLSHLPTAPSASLTFQRLRLLTHQHQLALSALSGTSLLLAYTLSPSRSRHPYMLWAVLAVGVGYWREVYGGVVGVRKKKGKEGEGVGVEEGGAGAGVIGSRTPDTGSSDEEWEVEGEGGSRGGSGSGGMNGEAVREGMEKWRMKMVEMGAVWGVGWLVTVVGLWGDRFEEMS